MNAVRINYSSGRGGYDRGIRSNTRTTVNRQYRTVQQVAHKARIVRHNFHGHEILAFFSTPSARLLRPRAYRSMG